MTVLIASLVAFTLAVGVSTVVALAQIGGAIAQRRQRKPVERSTEATPRQPHRLADVAA